MLFPIFMKYNDIFHKLLIERTYQIKYIKTLFGIHFNLPINSLQLRYRYDRLDDDKYIYDYPFINSHDTIIVFNKPNKIQLFIKNDRTVLIDIEREESIKKLYDMVSNKIEIPKRYYRLNYQGKTIRSKHNYNNISDYNITNNATLTIYPCNYNK
jgi:hypothetical protein